MRVTPEGQPVVPTEASPYEMGAVTPGNILDTEGMAFRNWLTGGQRRDIGDVRGTYAGLSDYLRGLAAAGGGGLGADIVQTGLDPRFASIFGGVDKEGRSLLPEQIVQASTAALGFAPGMSGRISRNLGSIYNRMQSLYGPTQAASRFADWVGTAYDAPTYQPYSPGAPWQQQTATSLGAQPTYLSQQDATAALAESGWQPSAKVAAPFTVTSKSGQPAQPPYSSMQLGTTAYGDEQIGTAGVPAKVSLTAPANQSAWGNVGEGLQSLLAFTPANWNRSFSEIFSGDKPSLESPYGDIFSKEFWMGR